VRAGAVVVVVTTPQIPNPHVTPQGPAMIGDHTRDANPKLRDEPDSRDDVNAGRISTVSRPAQAPNSRLSEGAPVSPGAPAFCLMVFSVTHRGIGRERDRDPAGRRIFGAEARQRDQDWDADKGAGDAPQHRPKKHRE